MSANTLVATLLAMAGQRNVITVPRAFVQFTGSIEAAMMLNQLLYWKPRAHGDAIYKTDQDWAEELCLTRYAVRKARERLEELGVLTIEVHHVRGSRAVHYFIDYDALVERWESWLQKQEVKFENELYSQESKVRKRTLLAGEQSSKTNFVKFENELSMNHRVPTENTNNNSNSARAFLRDSGFYNGAITKILDLDLDLDTLRASIQALASAGWGVGAIYKELIANPPQKGVPYATPTPGGSSAPAGGGGQHHATAPVNRARSSRSAGSHNATGGADLRDPGWQEREIARINAIYGTEDL
jgi:hypothetical protein